MHRNTSQDQSNHCPQLGDTKETYPSQPSAISNQSLFVDISIRRGFPNALSFAGRRTATSRKAAMSRASDAAHESAPTMEDELASRARASLPLLARGGFHSWAQTRYTNVGSCTGSVLARDNFTGGTGRQRSWSPCVHHDGCIRWRDVKPTLTTFC